MCSVLPFPAELIAKSTKQVSAIYKKTKAGSWRLSKAEAATFGAGYGKLVPRPPSPPRRPPPPPSPPPIHSYKQVRRPPRGAAIKSAGSPGARSLLQSVGERCNVLTSLLVVALLCMPSPEWVCRPPASWLAKYASLSLVLLMLPCRLCRHHWTRWLCGRHWHSAAVFHCQLTAGGLSNLVHRGRAGEGGSCPCFHAYAVVLCPDVHQHGCNHSR